jgi:hypothetical protein
MSDVLVDYACPPLVLRDAALAFIRETFGTQLATVDSYGGVFTEAEITSKSFLAPAVHVAVLGWAPVGTSARSTRLAGLRAWRVSMVAFVTVKAIDRETRADQAVRFASALADVLRTWHPSGHSQGVELGALEDDAECENLYSRKADELGVARWLVRWEQVVQGQSAKRFVPKPLYDLAQVEITNSVHVHVDQAAAASTPPVVTDSISFNQIDPAV